MKRILGILAGLAALAVSAYWGMQLNAQQPTGGATGGAGEERPLALKVDGARPLQTRIGVINLGYVLKNYKNFTEAEKTLRAEVEKLQGEKLNPLVKEVTDLQNEAKLPATTPARQEQIQKRLAHLQLEGKEAEEGLKKIVAEKTGAVAQRAFQDVEDVVTKMAKQYSYEMIMFYNDAVTKAEFYHANALRNKLLSHAALMPMYVAPGMDISDAVVASLNSGYRPATPAAGATPTTGGVMPAGGTTQPGGAVKPAGGTGH